MDNPTDPAARLDPPYAGSEADLLAAFLDYQRRTLALKCDGLTAEQLRERSVPPSGLTLLGLLRHLAEVEQYWYQVILRGEDLPPLYYTDEDPDRDFHGVADSEPAEVLAVWRRQVELAEQAVRGLPLETVARRERRGDYVTLRWIQLHMIEEYARHCGHADLLRETADGATGD